MKKQNQLSPEKYIRQKARLLPILECYVNKEWQNIGMAQIIVCRKHTIGNVTLGFYLVDTFALGVKDSFFRFNISPAEYADLVNTLKQNFKTDNADELIKTEYVTVHNIIYGALEFAKEYGYKPCKEFDTTQYILEEDTEEIELIEFEFGKNGKPLLIL